MDDDTRKEVLVAWQKRKQEEIQHPFLGEKILFGLVPYVQALLLARHLRGDMDAYPPFVRRRSMMVLVTYDVNTESAAGRKRLRRVAKQCKSWGQRVQKSVFECLVDPAQWAELRRRLVTEMNDQEDSIRFYFLGATWRRKVEHHGLQHDYDPEGPLVV